MEDENELEGVTPAISLFAFRDHEMKFSFQKRSDGGKNLIIETKNQTCVLDKVLWPLKLFKNSLSRGFDIKISKRTYEMWNFTFIGYNGSRLEYFDFEWKKESETSDFMVNRARGTKYLLIEPKDNNENNILETFFIAEDMWRSTVALEVILISIIVLASCCCCRYSSITLGIHYLDDED